MAKPLHPRAPLPVFDPPQAHRRTYSQNGQAGPGGQKTGNVPAQSAATNRTETSTAASSTTLAAAAPKHLLQLHSTSSSGGKENRLSIRPATVQKGVPVVGEASIAPPAPALFPTGPVSRATTAKAAATAAAATITPPGTTGRCSHVQPDCGTISYKHTHVAISISVSASVFVAGDIVTGAVRLSTPARAGSVTSSGSGSGVGSAGAGVGVVAVNDIRVELCGFEEAAGQRQVFVTVGADITTAGPTGPGRLRLARQDGLPVRRPVEYPFRLRLPESARLPTFSAKSGRVRYAVGASAIIHDGGRPCLLETSIDVFVLPAADPTTVLRPFSNPHVAVAEWRDEEAPLQYIRMAASLFRPAWISGTSLFVDVEIVNRSRRPVRKLDLELERHVVQPAGQSQHTHRHHSASADLVETVGRAAYKATKPARPALRWSGVGPFSAVSRTFELDLPRGHVSVPAHLFEVRFEVVVTATTSARSALSAGPVVRTSLPVQLVHMSSLDIVPKRPSGVTGAGATADDTADRGDRAASSSLLAARPDGPVTPARRLDPVVPSTTPLLESFQKACADAAELAQIGRELDRSPRKYGGRSGVGTAHVPPNLVVSRPSRGGNVADMNRASEEQQVARPGLSLGPGPVSQVGGASSQSNARNRGRGSQRGCRYTCFPPPVEFRVADVNPDRQDGPARTVAASEALDQVRGSRSSEQLRMLALSPAVGAATDGVKDKPVQNGDGGRVIARMRSLTSKALRHARSSLSFRPSGDVRVGDRA